jgi:hypothetical protein
MPERIRISGKQLAIVIKVWLRAVPEWCFGEEPKYAKLKAQKRHDPFAEPDARSIISDRIAAEIDRLEWEVTHPSPQHPGSPPAWTSTPTSPVPPHHQPGNHGQGDD